MKSKIIVLNLIALLLAGSVYADDAKKPEVKLTRSQELEKQLRVSVDQYNQLKNQIDQATGDLRNMEIKIAVLQGSYNEAKQNEAPKK